MIAEVRRQFKEIPGIMEGTGEPDYTQCVAISTQAAVREMVAPGILIKLSAILSLVFVPFFVGYQNKKSPVIAALGACPPAPSTPNRTATPQPVPEPRKRPKAAA